MLLEAIAVSLVYGFFYFELTGLVGGGLIAPGYFALHFDRPWVVGFGLVTALLTMGVVRGLSSFTLLYGRRRFIVSVLVAFGLQWATSGVLRGSDLMHGADDVVGYIIPGLVAHEMDRQGIGQTLVSLLVGGGRAAEAKPYLESWIKTGKGGEPFLQLHGLLLGLGDILEVAVPQHRA